MAEQKKPPTDGASRETGIIEVHVNEIEQLFNSIDPSPFREKDLDDDAHEFILSWAKELPVSMPLTLLVHLDRGAIPAEAQAMLTEAVHGFYSHRAELARQRLHQLLRTGRTSLIIGLAFLAGCILLGDWVGHRAHEIELGEILHENLLIGGWVAMWRPLEIFLYDWWPIRNEARIYDRLSQMKLQIRCSNRSDSAAFAPRRSSFRRQNLHEPKAMSQPPGKPKKSHESQILHPLGRRRRVVRRSRGRPWR